MKKLSLLIPLSSFLLFGCDETTNVTETTGPTSVAKFKDLAECTDENEGDLVYVKDSAAAYLCADGVWNVLSASAADGSDGKDGSDGSDGKNGENGTSCTATALKDKSGFELTCGGKVVGTITNGTDGENGTSCTATALKDKSGFELTCGGKVVGTITNGTDGTNGLNGENGTSCEGKKNKDGSVTISCGGKEVATIKSGDNGKSAYELSGFEGTEEEWLETLKGKDGANGENCTSEEKENGVVTLKCGDEDAVTLYKAVCGNQPFDPSKKFCYGLKLYDFCGGEVYDPENQFCYGLKPYDLCDGKVYDPENQFCAMRGDDVERVYKKVTIGTQTWMAENLNYQTENSWCGGGSGTTEGDCETYGRLYTWATAMGKDESTCGIGYECDLDTGDVQGVCPDGWHLPSKAEWEALFTAVGGEFIAGRKLRGTTLWKAEDGITNEDAYGFSALPAGKKYYYGDFSDAGDIAYFWSATQYDEDDAYYLTMHYDADNAYFLDFYKYIAYSVRCLENSN